MTWIIGSSAFFSGSILISDIRMTFNDKHDDCLQKIYPIGKEIMCGFSGSVSIGFEIIERLLELTKHESSKKHCSGIRFAHARIPRIGRRSFKKARKIYRRCGCSIIMASADPTLNLGGTPFARTGIHIFRHPDFKPVKVDRQNIDSIGSGITVTAYLNALNRIKADRSLPQLGANHPDMLAAVISHGIMKTIETVPKEDVSPYLQFGVVRRNEATVTDPKLVYGGTLKFIPIIRNGVHTAKVELVEPNHNTAREVNPPTHMIRSKKEFEKYCSDRGISGADARC